MYNICTFVEGSPRLTSKPYECWNTTYQHKKIIQSYYLCHWKSVQCPGLADYRQVSQSLATPENRAACRLKAPHTQHHTLNLRPGLIDPAVQRPNHLRPRGGRATSSLKDVQLLHHVIISQNINSTQWNVCNICAFNSPQHLFLHFVF